MISKRLLGFHCYGFRPSVFPFGCSDYLADLHGWGTPHDPSTHGSRGYVEARSNQQLNAGGYEEGPRMDGMSSVYGWRETQHAFEVVVLIRPGLRKQHFSWRLTPRTFKLDVNGVTVGRPGLFGHSDALLLP